MAIARALFATTALWAIVGTACASSFAQQRPFAFTAYSCNVSMPPSTPVMGVGASSNELYYLAWGSEVWDATTLKLLRKGDDVGVYLAIADATTGYAVKSFGTILNTTGMGLFKVDLTTLTSSLVGKLQFPRGWSIESMAYPSSATSKAGGDVYATVSTGFMLGASMFAQVDTSSAALVRSVQLMYPTNSGDSGLASPAFDVPWNKAFFWTGPSTLTSVDLDTFEATNMTTHMSHSFNLGGQPAAIVGLPNTHLVGYVAQVRDVARGVNKIQFVIEDLHDATVAPKVLDVEFNQYMNASTAMPLGTGVFSGTSVDDSYFYFAVYDWRLTSMYRVSAAGEMVVAPPVLSGMADIETAIVANPDAAFLMMEVSTVLPPPNGTHYPDYPCAFMMGRFGF